MAGGGLDVAREAAIPSASVYFLAGEAPTAATVFRPDLWLLPDDSGMTHTANRLLRLTGWTIEKFVTVFPWRTNVWTNPARLWAVEGRDRAERIKRDVVRSDVRGIVVIGRRAAECFGLREWPYFVWSGAWTRPIAVIPPPSGRCMFWNEPGARENAQQFFGGLAQ